MRDEQTSSKEVGPHPGSFSKYGWVTESLAPHGCVLWVTGLRMQQ